MNFRLVIKAFGLSILAFFLAYVCYQFSYPVFHEKSEEFLETVSIKANYKTFEEEVSFKDVDTVVVQALTAAVQVNKSQRGEGKLSLTTGQDKRQAVKTQREGRRVLIKTASLGPYINSTLSLKIPSTVKTLNIKTTLGNVNLNQLDLSNLQVVTTLGNIRLNQVSIQAADLESVNGNVQGDGAIQKAQIKTVLGDIKLSTSFNAPHYRFETVNGNIHLTVPRALNAEIDVHSINGSIRREDHHAEYKDASGYIHVKTVTGNITIDN